MITITEAEAACEPADVAYNKTEEEEEGGGGGGGELQNHREAYLGTSAYSASA